MKKTITKGFQTKYFKDAGYFKDVMGKSCGIED